MSDSYRNIDKINKVQNEVEQVKLVMGENIEKILQRGEKVEVLLDKSNELSNESMIFRNSSKKLKRKMCFKNVKFYSIIILVIVVIVIIIISTN